MKKKLISLFFASTLLLVGCGPDTEDPDLNDPVDDVEESVDELEDDVDELEEENEEDEN